MQRAEDGDREGEGAVSAVVVQAGEVVGKEEEVSVLGPQVGGGDGGGRLLPVAQVVRSPLCCCGVRFSPFPLSAASAFEQGAGGDRIAVCGSQYFGIVGNGCQQVFELPVSGTGEAKLVREFRTPDGLYDCAWSECNEHQLVSASADGSVLLFDLRTTADDFPIVRWKDHAQECCSVHWNSVDRTRFCSSSWDGTVKVWHPERDLPDLTLGEHFESVYSVRWSPQSAHQLASASGDFTFKIWDVRVSEDGRSCSTVPAHENEVMCIDWDKYLPHTLYTGSVDRSIRQWDLRNTAFPITIAQGAHDYAVRGLAASPHQAGLLASVSYDMRVRLWQSRQLPVSSLALSKPQALSQSNSQLQPPLTSADDTTAATPSKHNTSGRNLASSYRSTLGFATTTPPSQLDFLGECSPHSEFAIGVDWSLFHRHTLASTSWDCTSALMHVDSVV